MNYIQGNSNISHTYHIYLDSDAGRRSGDAYQFDISPTIEVQFPQRGNLYLKEFSGINNLYNINESNQNNTITVNGTDYPRQLPVGNYATLDDMVAVLNATFQGAADSQTTFAVFQNATHPNVASLKIQASNPGTNLQFSGPVFEKMLRFTVNEVVTSPHVSLREVDIHRATHNVYMSIAEVTNNTRDVGTAAGKGNRVAKIPITTRFGAYVVYQALEPVQKSPVENSMLNQLNIQLFDDDGHSYIPDRFTLTLALEIMVPVQTDYQNQITDMPGNYSTSKRHPILAPAIRRFC